MQSIRSHIIAELQKEINSLQGFRPRKTADHFDAGLGKIKQAFPNACFPLGAMHEFLFDKAEDAAATCGFITGLTASLMKKGGNAIWIGTGKKIFPPALHAFGIRPEKIIFLDLQKEKEILWATEEALKCNSVAAVVTEAKLISMIASRRLQLATEQSGVTGFIIHNDPKRVHTTACIARWRITSLASRTPQGMPGMGFPGWNVELLKVRNGTPGAWQLEFSGGRFKHLTTIADLQPHTHKQTG